ncbi:hypothetical protein F5Y08DRAFT_33693 [Xylaria arbuscula]|nr:hypothetical protein F5Y08DRAFT_33693 [Xylaria arbuscula]
MMAICRQRCTVRSDHDARRWTGCLLACLLFAPRRVPGPVAACVGLFYMWYGVDEGASAARPMRRQRRAVRSCAPISGGHCARLLLRGQCGALIGGWAWAASTPNVAPGNAPAMTIRGHSGLLDSPVTRRASLLGLMHPSTASTVAALSLPVLCHGWALIDSASSTSHVSCACLPTSSTFVVVLVLLFLLHSSSPRVWGP